MSLPKDITERLLIAKNILGKIRFQQISNPDYASLAMQILSAHDAAELLFAAIANHLNMYPKNKKPDKDPLYLMDYIIGIVENSGKSVPSRSFFSKLNTVRNDIKHKGIFPRPQYWFRVGENTYEHLSESSQIFLDISLDDLDEAELINNEKIRELFRKAQILMKQNEYKNALETLASAEYLLFETNQAIRGLKVGSAKAEDAIKLSAFGINSNDYLVLQEFLPRISENNGKILIKWDQKKYGHPANWRENAASFCIRTFMHIVICMQDAVWIPGAIDFIAVYEHQIEALDENVEIVKVGTLNSTNPADKIVLKVLKKGDILRGLVRSPEHEAMNMYFAELTGIKLKKVIRFFNPDEKLSGEIEKDKIKITCIPRDNYLVRDYFPDLPEIPFEE